MSPSLGRGRLASIHGPRVHQPAPVLPLTAVYPADWGGCEDGKGAQKSQHPQEELLGQCAGKGVTFPQSVLKAIKPYHL